MLSAPRAIVNTNRPLAKSAIFCDLSVQSGLVEVIVDAVDLPIRVRHRRFDAAAAAGDNIDIVSSSNLFNGVIRSTYTNHLSAW